MEYIKLIKTMKDNKKEFIELLEKYKSITIEDIERIQEKVFRPSGTNFGLFVMDIITGLGDVSKCILCKKGSKPSLHDIGFLSDTLEYIDINQECHFCYWKKRTGFICHSFVNSRTYYAICNAKNKTELFEAIQGRIKRMEDVLNY
jgi:hypothetical protein